MLVLTLQHHSQNEVCYRVADGNDHEFFVMKVSRYPWRVFVDGEQKFKLPAKMQRDVFSLLRQCLKYQTFPEQTLSLRLLDKNFYYDDRDWTFLVANNPPAPFENMIFQTASMVDERGKVYRFVGIEHVRPSSDVLRDKAAWEQFLAKRFFAVVGKVPPTVRFLWFFGRKKAVPEKLNRKQRRKKKK